MSQIKSAVTSRIAVAMTLVYCTGSAGELHMPRAMFHESPDSPPPLSPDGVNVGTEFAKARKTTSTKPIMASISFPTPSRLKASNFGPPYSRPLTGLHPHPPLP